MKVLTFGSIVSKLIAQKYVLFNGGKLVSSVIDNRSDYFVENFIRKSFDKSAYDEVAAVLENEEARFKNILLNQHFAYLGKGTDNSLKNFFDADGDIDLIIIDNQIDLERGLYYLSDPKKNFYLSPKTVQLSRFNKVSNSDIGYLISNMKVIITYLQVRFPKAKILFFNFPIANFKNLLREAKAPQVHKKMVENSLRYQEEMLRINNIYNITNWEIPRKSLTRDPTIFTDYQYCGFAGIIFTELMLDKV